MPTYGLVTTNKSSDLAGDLSRTIQLVHSLAASRSAQAVSN